MNVKIRCKNLTRAGGQYYPPALLYLVALNLIFHNLFISFTPFRLKYFARSTGRSPVGAFGFFDVAEGRGLAKRGAQ